MLIFHYLRCICLKFFVIRTQRKLHDCKFFTEEKNESLNTPQKPYTVELKNWYMKEFYMLISDRISDK